MADHWGKTQENQKTPAFLVSHSAKASSTYECLYIAFFITVLFMHFNSLPVSKYNNKFTLLLRIWKQVSVTNMVHFLAKQNMPFAFFYD